MVFDGMKGVLSGLAELGSVAIFIGMILVWADALPIL
jgi:hypothetical protein